MGGMGPEDAGGGVKNLYVGCRVRILWSENFPELNGTEGLIIAHDPPKQIYDKNAGEWVVSADLWGSHISPKMDFEFGPHTGWQIIHCMRQFCPHSEQLEPIVPDGIIERFEEEALDEEDEFVYVESK